VFSDLKLCGNDTKHGCMDVNSLKTKNGRHFEKMADLGNTRVPEGLGDLGIRLGILEMFANDPNMAEKGPLSIILNIGRHFVKSVQKLNPNAKIEKSNGSNLSKWS